MTKYTKHDNFTEIRSLIETSMLDNELQDRLLAFVDHELSLLDKRSNARGARLPAGSMEDNLTSCIAKVLSSEYKDIPAILELVKNDGGYAENVSVQKIAYRLNKLVETGFAAKEDKVIKEKGKPTRHICVYALANGETEEA